MSPQRSGLSAAVEADDAVKAELGVGRGEERLRAAEAEADRAHAPRAGALAQRGERRRDVELHRRRARLLHVRPVVEVLAARAEPGGAAEVVDRDRVVAGGREALGELEVERVEAADVREDHHRRAARLRRLGQRRPRSACRRPTRARAAPPRRRRRSARCPAAGRAGGHRTRSTWRRDDDTVAGHARRPVRPHRPRRAPAPRARQRAGDHPRVGGSAAAPRLVQLDAPGQEQRGRAARRSRRVRPRDRARRRRDDARRAARGRAARSGR